MFGHFESVCKATRTWRWDSVAAISVPCSDTVLGRYLRCDNIVLTHYSDSTTEPRSNASSLDEISNPHHWFARHIATDSNKPARTEPITFERLSALGVPWSEQQLSLPLRATKQAKHSALIANTIEVH